MPMYREARAETSIPVGVNGNRRRLQLVVSLAERFESDGNRPADVLLSIMRKRDIAASYARPLAPCAPVAAASDAHRMLISGRG